MARTTSTQQPNGLNTEAARQLYASGHNDHEIAAELGISVRAVWTWRQGEKLPPVSRRSTTSRVPRKSPQRRGPKPRLDEQVAMTAWLAGKTDREIAETCGCSVSTITSWRKRYGLDPNRAQRPTRAKEKAYDLPAAEDEARAREAGLSYGIYKARQWEADGRPAHRKRAVPDLGTGKR